MVKKNHNSSIFSFESLKVVVFGMVLLLSIFGIGGLLTEYDDIQKRWDFLYDLPKNSLDVLILGNSHAYSTYSPNIIDAICGTNSFVLASNSQRLEQTYFNLKEVLKYQKPRVVVIQVSVFSGNGWKTFKGDSRIYSNLDGMRFSQNKIDAIRAQRPTEDYLKTLIPILHNHEMWKNPKVIGENLGNLFSNKTEDYRGFSPRKSEMDSVVMKKFDGQAKMDFTNYRMTNFDLGYLDRIKELSSEHNFKVVYVMSPKYPDLISPTYTNRYKKINDVMLSLNHDYLDFNILSQEIGLGRRSFENGFISHQHTSYFGAIQVSRYLANYLIEHHLEPGQDRGSDYLWKKRMSTKKEYFLYGLNNSENINSIYSSNQKLQLFDSIIIEKIHILKQKKNHFELAIEFDENLSVQKLEGYKFSLHLYPKASGDKSKQKGQSLRFENFDFEPIVLPYQDDRFFTVGELKTKTSNVEKITLGLYKPGTTSKSAKMIIENITLD